MPRNSRSYRCRSYCKNPSISRYSVSYSSSILLHITRHIAQVGKEVYLIFRTGGTQLPRQGPYANLKMDCLLTTEKSLLIVFHSRLSRNNAHMASPSGWNAKLVVCTASTPVSPSLSRLQRQCHIQARWRHFEFGVRYLPDALQKYVEHRTCCHTAQCAPRQRRAVGAEGHRIGRHRAYYPQPRLHRETEMIPGARGKKERKTRRRRRKWNKGHRSHEKENGEGRIGKTVWIRIYRKTSRVRYYSESPAGKTVERQQFR